MQVSTIGIDLAKNVFQIHGVDTAGKVVMTKKLRRAQVLSLFEGLPRCLIGMEACATSHHWARELKALGHDVRMMPASYVKAYVKRSKNDAADAAAICEAVTRPSMRFVPVKTAEQQAVLMLHRTRDLLVRQRTQLINAMRAHLAELGLVAAQGRDGLTTLIGIVRDKKSQHSGSGARGFARPARPIGCAWPADRRHRAPHPCRASIERREPALGNDTRNWRDWCDCDCRRGA